jgi:hypothetical protein
VAVGIIVWWFRTFTNWFEPIVPLLGLGGSIAWVWAAWGKERQKAWHEWVTGLFEDVRLERGASLILLVFLLFCLFWGTVHVENLDQTDTLVKVTDTPEGTTDESDRLMAGHEQNSAVFLFPWQQAKRYVKVSGLPMREVTISPWWRTLGRARLQVPGSFLRPIVLVGGDLTAVSNSKASPKILTITVNNTPYEIPYKGKAVLVGLISSKDNDLPLPESVATSEEWKKVMANVHTGYVLMPPEPTQKVPPLRGGEYVSAQLKDESDPKNILAETATVQVLHPADRGTLVVPILLISRH